MTPIVSMQAIAKSYWQKGSEIPVLRDFDLEVKPGEIVGLVGSSGSGKTTVVNILALLDRPDSGSYYLEDMSTSSFGPLERESIRRRRIGLVFQEFNLLPQLTAEENIVYFASRDWAAGELKDRAGKLAADLGITHVLRKFPRQLSGGEAQRVAIARALISGPRLVLADEPTGSLDQSNGDKIMGIFRRIANEGVAIVIVTHDGAVAASCDRICRLEQYLC